MSNIYEVKVNEYRKNLREIILTLPSVNECLLYNGQLNTDDLGNVKIDLSKQKSTCFIDVTSGTFVENKVIQGIDLECNFMIYIAGRNDYNSSDKGLRTNSEICVTSMYEIVEQLYQNKANLDVIGYPDFNSFTQVTSGEREKVRFSIFAMSFSQKINFFKKNK